MCTAIKGFFTTILYEPLYNALIFILDLLPSPEVGLAVIILTLFVKLALLPLSLKAVKTQAAVKEIQPQIDEIKSKYEDDKQKQAMEMMKVYEENGIKPFSSFGLLLIQFPIIIALYYVFLRGGLPDIDQSMLYSFVSSPGTVDMQFLGINIAEKSFILAAVAGVSQFIQTQVSSVFSSPAEEKDKEDTAVVTDDGEIDFASEFKKNFGKQMKYIFPFLVFFISWSLAAVVALYWATSNLFHALQEVYVRYRS